MGIELRHQNKLGDYLEYIPDFRCEVGDIIVKDMVTILNPEELQHHRQLLESLE